jgi:hypothetical protein
MGSGSRPIGAASWWINLAVAFGTAAVRGGPASSRTSTAMAVGTNLMALLHRRAPDEVSDPRDLEVLVGCNGIVVVGR